MNEKELLGDKLCEYCPLDKRGAYSLPGGFQAGCEGKCCDEAYQEYLNKFTVHIII